MERIAILAGGGTLPQVLADSIAERGGRAHIVGVRGEAGPAIETYPHTWVTWGAVSAIISTLKRESDGAMMIAGSVSRPDLMRLKPDFGVIRYLPDVLAMLRGGDDAVLTRLIRFFEAQGLTVKGVADIAPQLLAEAGTFGAAGATSPAVAADTALGFQVLDELADLDVGQAIAVEGGRILAIEGVEGTDRMLTRIVHLPGRTLSDRKGPAVRTIAAGVLVKGPKRGQDMRVDMPAVGAQTITRLAEARLGTLVVVAGTTLLLERDEMVRRARDTGITINGITRVSAAAPTSSAKPARSTARFNKLWAGPQLGRLAPSAADTRDIHTAATITQRLRPFTTGSAAVVVRDHVLAVAAAEPPDAMARRVAILRQWGRGRFRRSLGAAAVALDAAGPDAVLGLVEGLAGAGIAGVAVVATDGASAAPCAAAIPASAIAAADRLGMFLVVVGPVDAISSERTA